jgi:predicted ATPase/anti-anti-sigma regulatory factor
MLHIDDYTVVSKIHEGPNTILYGGHRNVDHAPIVAKVPRSEYPSPRELAKLRHEYALLKSLDLPGVVRAYALARCGSGLALVLESLTAQPLSVILGGDPLALSTGLRIGINLADILAGLQRQRVVHKDIKPQNILVDPRTHDVHVIDFSIATRLTQALQRAIHPNSLEGTLAYMSPEQTGRMNRVIDLRSDLYSVGVVLYEMIVGRLPFQTTDPVELVYSHIARVPARPTEARPDIPEAVSDVVMKLLAKTAEERYQSAQGLKADLAQCLASLQASGQIPRFTLGQHDQTGELRIPQRLYGRDAELRELTTAFERARQGSAELLLISGYSGIGKSALVHEIYKPITRQGGYFVSGKFEQQNRSVPYASIGQAFRELCRQLLSERSDALLRWREQIQAALGASGRLLTELIPELELIVGPQPEVPALPPNESQNRFNLVFQRFLRVFTTPEHALVLFLDDLQWADPASLKLLHVLLTDLSRRPLLVLGTYRDNEVDAAHPLTLMLEELRKNNAVLRRIEILPLSLSDTCALLSDTLASEPAHVEPLARVILEKTHGNPFFVNQLVGLLHEEKLLNFDVDSGVWHWDLSLIKKHHVTDNVVDLMAGKIQRLTPATQRALELAACIGHQFDLLTLSIICEESPPETAAHLWEGLREGLLLPIDTEYRLVGSGERIDAVDDVSPPGAALNASYKFLHDRVQQAAYSLILSASRQEIHLRIGRLLRASRDLNQDEALFELVNHLNLGAALISDPEERVDLLRLNLRAGTRAKEAAAYAAAASYFAAGLLLVDEALWQRKYDLCFALGVQRAECEYLSGSFEQAESLFDELLSRATVTLDQARIYTLRIILYSTVGKWVDALRTGRAGLHLFGIELPETEEAQRAALQQELTEVPRNIAGRPIADLIDAPLMTDPNLQVVVKLLTLLTGPTYVLSPSGLFGIVCVKAVNLALKHGNTDGADEAYVRYGLMLASLFGQYREAYAFGQLALAVNEKLHNVKLTSKVYYIFALYLHFCRPFPEVLRSFERCQRAALETGDFLYLAISSFHSVMVRFAAGEELSAIGQHVDKQLSLVRRTGNAVAIGCLNLLRQQVASLSGQTVGPHTLDSDSFTEVGFLEEMTRQRLLHAVFFYVKAKLQLLFLFEDYPSALRMAVEAEERAANALAAHAVSEACLYRCLTLTALYPSTVSAEQRRVWEALTLQRVRLAAWAESCPENYQHLHLLVEAERARLQDDESEAMALYEQAIEMARQGEYVHYEALASELCGKFHLSRARPRVAHVYMLDAYHAYLRWGATAKAQHLAERYLHGLPPEPSASGLGSHTALPFVHVTQTTTREIPTAMLDVAAIMRAAQTIASEIELPKVLDHLMHIVLENAGAQRGALLLVREERLVLEAVISTAPDAVEIGMETPLEDCADLPETVIQYAARTRVAVVLPDASRDNRFAMDPFVAVRSPKSILALPLVYHGRLTGLLYLENNLTHGAFSASRIELLQMLSAQAAIAVENALLYSRLQIVSNELRDANERLEQQVALRTEELRIAYERLQGELCERERSEQVRAELQQQIIHAQSDLLAELSTPLIPIAEHVMVMPLIGMVDAQRAERIMHTALLGAQDNRAKAVIIDITGIKQMDASVASSLLGTARALRLLGALTVLTGIRGEVAKTLLGLGIELRGIETRSTLQRGIAYALQAVSVRG